VRNLVPNDIQYPFPQNLSSKAKGLTIQEGLQQHREELCLVQRDATGTHVSERALVRHPSEHVCLRQQKEQRGKSERRSGKPWGKQWLHQVLPLVYPEHHHKWL